MPTDTTLERTDAAVRDFESYLRTVAEVTDFESYVGTVSPVDFNGLSRKYFLRQPPPRPLEERTMMKKGGGISWAVPEGIRVHWVARFELEPDDIVEEAEA